MNMPNWIIVTVKETHKETPPDGNSYIRKQMQSSLPEWNCSFYSEEQNCSCWLVCQRTEPNRYEFKIPEDQGWSKALVMELCGILLQCPETDNVLVGEVIIPQTAEPESSMVVLWHNLKEHLQPQFFRAFRALRHRRLRFER